jgi:hypothetical protein
MLNALIGRLSVHAHVYRGGKKTESRTQLKNVKLIYNDKQKPRIRTLERPKVTRSASIYNCKRKLIHVRAIKGYMGSGFMAPHINFGSRCR